MLDPTNHNKKAKKEQHGRGAKGKSSWLSKVLYILYKHNLLV